MPHAECAEAGGKTEWGPSRGQPTARGAQARRSRPGSAQPTPVSRPVSAKGMMTRLEEAERKDAPHAPLVRGPLPLKPSLACAHGASGQRGRTAAWHAPRNAEADPWQDVRSETVLPVFGVLIAGSGGTFLGPQHQHNVKRPPGPGTSERSPRGVGGRLLYARAPSAQPGQGTRTDQGPSGPVSQER